MRTRIGGLRHEGKDRDEEEEEGGRMARERERERERKTDVSGRRQRETLGLDASDFPPSRVSLLRARRIRLIPVSAQVALVSRRAPPRLRLIHAHSEARQPKDHTLWSTSQDGKLIKRLGIGIIPLQACREGSC